MQRRPDAADGSISEFPQQQCISQHRPQHGHHWLAQSHMTQDMGGGGAGHGSLADWLCDTDATEKPQGTPCQPRADLPNRQKSLATSCSMTHPDWLEGCGKAGLPLARIQNLQLRERDQCPTKLTKNFDALFQKNCLKETENHRKKNAEMTITVKENCTKKNKNKTLTLPSRQRIFLIY